MRGISDPRLSYLPELLITEGWERFDVADGYGYKFTNDGTPTAPSGSRCLSATEITPAA